jgi:hypothetical protein
VDVMPTTIKAKRKGAPRRASRGLSLKVAAREYIWLWDRRHGMRVEEIASRSRCSVNRVREGLQRARALEKGDVEFGQGGAGAFSAGAQQSLRLIPMFPLGSYTPQSTCAHHGPIQAGSLFCCMVCHHSGIDGHPALKRDPRTDPAPERKAAPAPAKKKALETRKVLRLRKFASKHAISS